VERMIEHEKEKYGWEFLFLGANIDAVETAGRFGIDSSRAVRYHSDSRGTRLNYETLSGAIRDLRAEAAIPESWKEEIEADYESREAD